MDKSFRHITPNDLEEVISIARNTVDKCYRVWLGNQAVERYLATRNLDNYLVDNFSNIFLLTENSKIMAFSICIENMIDFMLVDAEHQSQGIGARLLKICENLLFEKYSTISVESFELNTVPNKHLQANGWSYVNKYVDRKYNATKLIYTKKVLH